MPLGRVVPAVDAEPPDVAEPEVALAQEAGVVYEATDGRFMLGIGVGHQLLVESWHGTPFRRPVEAMRDYVTILPSQL